MIVGVPAERKPGENRVALTPDGVLDLATHGHRVLVETGAGAGSAIADDDFARAGAQLVGTEAAWGAELVLKVKEPQREEYGLLRPDLVLFTFLHLAAYPELADALLGAGTTAIGYETVRSASGALPLLAPMSEVAGRLAPQIGAHFLERGNGGRGVLLGGAPGVRPGRDVEHPVGGEGDAVLSGLPLGRHPHDHEFDAPVRSSQAPSPTCALTCEAPVPILRGRVVQYPDLVFEISNTYE